MRRLFCKALLIASLAVAGIAAATVVARPKAVNATYSATMNGMAIGAITERFEADGTTYRIMSETKPVGLATLLQRQPLKYASTGELTREGLRPLHFEGRRNAADPPQVSADFDWAQSQLNIKYNGKAEALPISAGTQDRLSIMYQLMFLQPEKSGYVEFWMTNGRKLDLYRYHAEPDVELDTALGRLKTVHLVKEREAGGSQAEVWISPRHQNVAVKVVIVEKDGMRYEQLIQSLEIRD
jgi:hypothetical protein